MTRDKAKTIYEFLDGMYKFKRPMQRASKTSNEIKYICKKKKLIPQL